MAKNIKILNNPHVCDYCKQEGLEIKAVLNVNFTYSELKNSHSNFSPHTKTDFSKSLSICKGCVKLIEKKGRIDLRLDVEPDARLGCMPCNKESTG